MVSLLSFVVFFFSFSSLVQSFHCVLFRRSGESDVIRDGNRLRCASELLHKLNEDFAEILIIIFLLVRKMGK